MENNYFLYIIHTYHYLIVMKLPQFDHILWGLGPSTDGSLTITPIEKEYHLQPSTSMGFKMSIFPYNKSGFEFIPVDYPTSVLDLFKVFFFTDCTMVNHHFSPPFCESIFWNFFVLRSILVSKSQALLGETFPSFFVAHSWVPLRS